MSKSVEIGGVRLFLSEPDPTDGQWIGQGEVLKQLLACWLVVDDVDLPLTPRLVGAPGIGKTTLAIAGARVRKQPLFIYQCTSDTRPEDLLVTPVLAESGKIVYHASPLVTAMLIGGICVLDEGNRMIEQRREARPRLLVHAVPFVENADSSRNHRRDQWRSVVDDLAALGQHRRDEQILWPRV